MWYPLQKRDNNIILVTKHGDHNIGMATTGYYYDWLLTVPWSCDCKCPSFSIQSTVGMTTYESASESLQPLKTNSV